MDSVPNNDPDPGVALRAGCCAGLAALGLVIVGVFVVMAGTLARDAYRWARAVPAEGWLIIAASFGVLLGGAGLVRLVFFTDFGARDSGDGG